MKKKIIVFLLIVVTFICTLQATWAYFKDTKVVSTDFHSEGLVSDVNVEITNKSFDFEKGITTATVTVTNNSSVNWNVDSVNLTFGTPIYQDKNQNYPLSNLFTTYYTFSISKQIVSKQQNVVKFAVEVKARDDLDLRLGVANIKFNVNVTANYGASNKPLTVHNSQDYIEIVSTPWDWPTDDKFIESYVKNMNDGTYIDKYHLEYHTPMYYGPGTQKWIDDRNFWGILVGKKPFVPSYNILPSLRYIRNSDIEGYGAFEDSSGNMNYTNQKNAAAYYFPKEIRYYAEDPGYSLIRGPIYYVPGKGFVCAYFMDYKDEVNDYGARLDHGDDDGNPVFKRLYMYQNKFYYLVRDRYWQNNYTYHLHEVDPMISKYAYRFVKQDGDKLIATYNDYNKQFTTRKTIYDPDYEASNLGYYKIMLNNEVINQNY